MNSLEQKQKSKKNIPYGLIAVCVFIVVASVLLFADLWYVYTYGRINFDSILFTLTANLSGSSSSLLLRYLWQGLLPAVILSAVLISILLTVRRKIAVSRRLVYGCACVLCAALIVFSAFDSQLVAYVVNTKRPSTLYTDEYRDPSQTAVSFPEKKRNLVYIMLESFETSFTTEEKGGAISNDLFPELYQLARENLNFSQNDGVGGYRPSTGATWTIGSIVSQTSGLPLAPEAGKDTESAAGFGKDEEEQGGAVTEGSMLSGATTLMDILHDNGYYQAVMVGSNAAFGNRELYYQTHNVDKIYDVYTAREDGIVAADYWDDWWGMEDYHLFDYAKQALSEISQREQPFAFTMLTVDTHHVNGNLCPYCEDTYEEQYDNVISCSSRQVFAFVQWLQQQDFYENTSVVIVGDHLSMDAAYARRNLDDSYVRRVYNCFLNCPISTEYAKNREFTTVDLFPTTLAAMGCSIEGNRLGLGVNLFCGEKTLCEQWGYDKLCTEFYGNRDYYSEHFTGSKK